MTKLIRMVLKVQLPLATNEPDPAYLIYNEDRSFEGMLPLGAVPELDAYMADKPKAYLEADVDMAEGGAGACFLAPLEDIGPMFEIDW